MPKTEHISLSSFLGPLYLRPQLGLLILAACGITGVILVLIATLPPKLTAGRVIDSVGTFRFPDGRSRLKIIQTDDGFVQFTVLRPVTKYYVLTTFVPGYQTSIDMRRDWFAAVDEYRRFWLFQGRWDPRRGTSRRLPGGGFAQHVQTVLFEGAWFLPNGDLVSGTNVASSTGDWAGVHPAFFDRIPGKTLPVWGQDAVIPAAPVSFTNLQLRAISKHLNRGASRF